MRDIDFIVVHCSATSPSMDIGVDWVRSLHTKKFGWKDVGYHYFVKRDGTIENGRPVSLAGAHVKGWNKRSIGVCYAGGVKEHDKSTPEDNRTDEQKESLRVLLNALSAEYHGAQVLGHRDFPNVSKACPSFDTKNWYYGED